MVQEDRWFYLTWLFVRTFSILGGSLSLFSVGLFGLPPGCLCLIRVVGQRVSGVCDDRLQFMAVDDALNLDEALGDEDVSRAWMCGRLQRRLPLLTLSWFA